MSKNDIIVKGARENNLKNISIKVIILSIIIKLHIKLISANHNINSSNIDIYTVGDCLK